MKANPMKIGGAAIAVALVATVGCGQFVRQGRSPSLITILALEGASGARPASFSGVLESDVVTVINRTVQGQQVPTATIFSDAGRVTMRLILKDQGTPGIVAVPSIVNQIQITRYRVEFRRTDGRNTPGVDVPFPFESAVTFLVPGDGTVTAGFELVRHTAKEEAPLAALRIDDRILSTIADVTFFGKDLAGNDVIVTGSIGILFGNFGDPT